MAICGIEIMPLKKPSFDGSWLSILSICSDFGRCQVIAILGGYYSIEFSPFCLLSDAFLRFGFRAH